MVGVERRALGRQVFTAPSNTAVDLQVQRLVLFFCSTKRVREKKTNEPKIRQDHNVYNVLSGFQTHTCTSSSMTDLASKLNISKPTSHTQTHVRWHKKREKELFKITA